MNTTHVSCLTMGDVLEVCGDIKEEAKMMGVADKLTEGVLNVFLKRVNKRAFYLYGQVIDEARGRK